MIEFRDMLVTGTFILHQLISVRRQFAVRDGCDHDVRENIGDLGAITKTTSFRDGQSKSDLFETLWTADLAQLRNIPGSGKYRRDKRSEIQVSVIMPRITSREQPERRSNEA